MYLFYCCSSIVVSISPPQISPSHPSPPLTLDPTPFGFVLVSVIQVPWWPFPIFSPLSPSHLPSGYCQFVLYFNVSRSTLLACLFYWLGSTYRWDLYKIYKELTWLHSRKTNNPIKNGQRTWADTSLRRTYRGPFFLMNIFKGYKFHSKHYLVKSQVPMQCFHHTLVWDISKIPLSFLFDPWIFKNLLDSLVLEF